MPYALCVFKEVQMDYLYFPGCTLYTKAKNFDQTARNCSRLLGFELKELTNWTCCGATFPLATDNIMALLPPSRILSQCEGGRNGPDDPLCRLLQCDQKDEPVDSRKMVRKGIRSTILSKRTIKEIFKSSTT